MTLTPKQRDEIRKRADATTPGPWGAIKGSIPTDDMRCCVTAIQGKQEYLLATIENGAPGDFCETEFANALFISYARTDVPALLAHIAEQDTALSAAERRAEAAEALAYASGRWKCAKCDFTLLQANLNTATGTVTARDQAGDKCPNCASPLWRVSWRTEAEENMEIAEQQWLRAKVAETERDALRARVAELERFSAFAASCIKSGEPWSDTCEEMYAAIFKKEPDDVDCAIADND